MAEIRSRLKWRARGLAIVAILSILAYFAARNAQLNAEAAERAARIAALEAHADTLERARRALEARAGELAHTYQADTARLGERVRTWRALARKAAIPDTVRDTVPVPVEILVAVADSTIGACTDALATCEARVAVERERGDSALALARVYQIVADSALHPPRRPLWWRVGKRLAEWLTVAKIARSMP